MDKDNKKLIQELNELKESILERPRPFVVRIDKKNHLTVYRGKDYKEEKRAKK